MLGKALKRAGALGGAGVLAAALLVPVGGAAAQAAPTPDRHSWTSPGSHSWTVPAGVHSVRLEVAGGQGGNDRWHDGLNWLGHPGGNGDELTGTLSVTPGDTLSIWVGARGGTGDTGGGDESAGYGGQGWRNGGDGGSGSRSPINPTPTHGQGGGGGGGSSAVLVNDSIIAHAGGGGGAGGAGTCGGNPGGHARGSGWKESNNCTSDGGDPGQAGATGDGFGEDGENAATASNRGGGGGGGGGVRGGGGADASTDGGGGGGGGTSACSLTGCTMSASNQGNGSVTLTAVHTPQVSFDESGYEAYAGQSVALSGRVSVSGSAPMPEGSVELVATGAEGSQVITTRPLDSQGRFASDCTAPCGLDSTDYDTIEARYLSSATDVWTNATGQAALNFVPGETQTALHIDPQQAVTGQTRDFIATVQVLQPARGAVTGDVEFFASEPDGSNTVSLGTAALNASYQAELSAPMPRAGNMRFWAEYLGVPFYNSSTSPPTTLFTEKAETEIEVSTVPNPTVTGQGFDAEIEIAVVAPGGGVPTGEVTVDGEPAALDADGLATVEVPGRSAGDYELDIVYAGDANYFGSSTTHEHVVEKADVALGLQVDPPTSEYGQELSFDASAVVEAPGAGTVEGEVEFGYLSEGEFVSLGDPGPLDAEEASLSFTGLDAGEYDFQARYLGSDDFNAAVSDPVAHVVGQTASTVIVAPVPEENTYGLEQLVEVEVRGPDFGDGALPAEGEVELFTLGESEPGEVEPLGEPATLDEDGMATLSFEWLEPADYTVFAEYAGSDNHLPATSETAAFTVVPAEPQVTLGGDASLAAGDEGEYTVGVTPVVPTREPAENGAMLEPLDAFIGGEQVLSFAPTGEVELHVDGEAVGTATLHPGGGDVTAAATLQHAFEEPGSYELTAHYEGSDYVVAGESDAFTVKVLAQPSEARAAGTGGLGTGLAGTGGDLAGAALLAAMLLGLGALGVLRYRTTSRTGRSA